MSNLKNFGVPEAKTVGIIRPMMAHQFRVIPFLGPDAQLDNLGDHFTNNIASVKLDLHTGTLSIKVRQSVDLKSFEAVQAVIQSGVPSLEMLDGFSDNPLFVIAPEGEIKSHELVLDYSKGEALCHEIVWSIKSIRTRAKS